MEVIRVPHIQQPDLEAIVRHQVDEFTGLTGDRLLVQEHQKPIQPLGRNAMSLRVQGQ